MNTGWTLADYEESDEESIADHAASDEATLASKSEASTPAAKLSDDEDGGSETSNGTDAALTDLESVSAEEYNFKRTVSFAD